ncbi:hypothetical protein Tco_0895675 [Tanacetum coccineum]|uniref:Reverse transcriptase domain-containing protein n=1 Tax=Tanacetum coccineum TaxID=301880 RepID=A0ABQ5CIH0_9ASTR
MERDIKRLKRSRIPLVKVRWNSRRGPEFTWEREDSLKRNTHISSQIRRLHPLQAFISSASSAVTYTSVYTDSEPGRVFWGADEEISDGEPVIPPPFIDITTIGAKGLQSGFRLSISLPPKARLRDFLCHTEGLHHQSPPISLSPPLLQGRALLGAQPPHLHFHHHHPWPQHYYHHLGVQTNQDTSGIASTQALVERYCRTTNTSTTTLPSSSLYIPPPVTIEDDIPESKHHHSKRFRGLFALGSRYEIGESSTARPTGGRGVDYRFVSTVDAEARRQGISEVGKTVWIVEEEQCFPRGWAYLDRMRSGDPSRSFMTHRDQVYDTRFSRCELAEMKASSETDRRPQAQMAETHRIYRANHGSLPARQDQNTPPNNTNLNNMTPESVQAMIDQALQQNSTNGDVGSMKSSNRCWELTRLCPSAATFIDSLQYDNSTESLDRDFASALAVLKPDVSKSRQAQNE